MRKWYFDGEALITSINKLQLPDCCTGIWSIGQCGFFYKFKNKVVLVDPVLTPIIDGNGVSKKHYGEPFSPSSNFPVDAVFCTHNHWDHLNADTITAIAASHAETQFFIPQAIISETAEIFAAYQERVHGLRQDQRIALWEDCSATAVAAAHDRYETDLDGNEKALGYVFSFGNMKFFHAGDTLATDRLVNDVNACGSIDAAFLPINGRDWIREGSGIIGNMTPQEAALFADMISCKTVFPTHYDMMLGNEESPLVFTHYMNLHYPSRAFHFLQLGEPFIMYK